ncbi:MAG: hypothetical protein IT306_30545 [Chloroflexi bacterium]|nr:hypothetical protein [Chloroflexota bacterium]
MADVPGASGPWRPAIGERVVVAKTGQTATVLRLAPTEWGLLCDLEIDPPPGAVGEEPERTVHASIELRPLAG